MPLPITRGELDRLGQRLAASEPVRDEDHDLLRVVLDVYDSEALPAVERKLHDLGFSPTTRVKTTGTLIDKLRRENGMRLSRMQDVAGARIVIDGTRREQDEAVARIVAAFGQHAKPPKDRRAQPSSGAAEEGAGMKHFLLVFDRPQGRLLSLKEYPTRRAALGARFDVEKKHKTDDVEVVVLNARSEAALRATHRRYFDPTEGLAV